jgi:hypothetical protein
MHQKKKVAAEIAAKIASACKQAFAMATGHAMLINVHVQYCIKDLNNLDNEIFASIISC